MKITPELLTRRGACVVSTALFAKRWPEGFDLSVEDIVAAENMGFFADWLMVLLSKEQRDVCEKERRAVSRWYNLRATSADEAYAGQQKAINLKYLHREDDMDGFLDETIAAADAHDEQLTPLRSERDRELAQLLYNALDPAAEAQIELPL